MKKLLQSLFILLFVASAAIAQDRTVTGTVTAKEDGLPLPGVSVKVKGANVGTQTGTDGKFSIKVSSDVKNLSFSFVGYASQDVAIPSSNQMRIVMSTSTNYLDDVIVVAYGTQKRRDAIGAVASISSAQLQKQQVTSITQGLQGLATGVLIINPSGQPGTSPTIRVRGIGSVNASASPLIVVDGIPFAGSLSTINPNDVEDMSVLKDAAATSLYGSRAANGVIVITTKKGKLGSEPSINFYSSFGSSSRAVKEFSYVNSEQYMKLAWEAQKNYAVSQGISNPGQYATNNLINPSTVAGQSNTFGLRYNPYVVNNPIDANGNLVPGAELKWNTDWLKELTNKHQFRKNMGASISGASDKVRYFMSADYLDQDGAVLNSNFNRISTRLNVDADVKKWFKTGLNLSVSQTKSNTPDQSGSAFRNAIQYGRIMSSIYPLYQRDNLGELVLDAAGNPIYDFGASRAATGSTVNHDRPVAANTNAVAIQTLDRNLDDAFQTSLNTFGEIKFTDYLKFTSNFGIERFTNSSLSYSNPTVGDAVPVGGRVTRGRSLTTTYTWNNRVNFDKAFGKHNVAALVSAEAYDLNIQSLTAGTTGFPLPGLFEIGSGATKETATSSTNRARIESYFSRVSYNYDGKYYLEGSVRTDGSTRFAPDKRWGVFYSIGGAWVISNEKFFQNLTFFDQVKLRGSYGEVGNDGTSSYFPYISGYATGYNDLSYPGVYLSSLGNPALTWEKLGTYNIGLDVSAFKNRVNLSVEYYNKNTFDLIFDKPLPASSGVSAIADNIGQLNNRGFEFTLNTQNVATTNFQWSSNLNVATLKNTIKKLPQQFLISGSTRLEVGRSLYDFWIFEWAGVNPQNGKPQWLSIANDGKVTVVNQLSATGGQPAATRHYQGSSLPKVTGGFSNNFTYRNFDMSVLVNFAFGGKVLDQDYIGLMHGFSTIGQQLHTDILNRWQKPGDITDVPALKFGQSDYGSASTRHLFSGDYLRLRNVTLGYTLPKTLLNKTNNIVKSFRVFLQADNLATWSKLKQGTDPELNLSGISGQSSSSFKTVSFGLNVGF